MKLPKINLFKEFILVSILSLFLAFIFTFPAIITLSSKFIGDGFDNYQTASYQSLAYHQIQNGDFPFTHTNFWRFPDGFDFHRGFDFYLPILTGTVYRFAFSIPLSYNLSILTLMVFNGVFSYLFFSRLARSRFIGFVGLIIYGFSFYVIAKAASHANLLFIGGVPLFFYALLRIWRSSIPSTLDYAVLAAGILVISLGSVQYAMLTIIMLTFYLIISRLFYPENTRNFFQKIFVSKKNIKYPALFTALIIAIFYLPLVKALFSSNIHVLDREKTLFEQTPHVLDFLLPNNYLPMLITRLISNPSSPSIEKVAFAGWIEIALFFAFFFYRISKKLKIYLGSLFLITLILAFGYGKDNSFFLLPYNALRHIFPFKLIPETGRYIVYFLFIMTSAIIILLSRMRDLPRRNLFGFLLVFLLILERLPSTFYTSPDFAKEKFINAVRLQESVAVLDLPIDYYNAKYNLYSLYYNKPIVNGYFHWSADGPTERAFVNDGDLLNRFMCLHNDPITQKGYNYSYASSANRELIALLRKNGILTIVVHKDDEYHNPICENVKLHLNTFLPNIHTLPPSLKNEEKQFALTSYDDEPSFTLYFPKAGKLYINGIYIAPTKPGKFSISYNNNPAPFDYKWNIGSDNSMQLEPKNKIIQNITAGSKMTILSDTYASSTYFSIWYRYIPSDSKELLQMTEIKKVFEDEKSRVYQIQ